MKLTTGQTYSQDLIDSLVLTGWTNAYEGIEDSLHYADYFDADGTYRGPDEDGVEPIFEDQ